MNLLADLINLEAVEKQNFILPKTLIYFIFNNSILNSRHKLIQTCKTFYLLHLKNGESWINSLNIFQQKYEIDIGDGKLLYHKNFFNSTKVASILFMRRLDKFKLVIQANRIKIINSLWCIATVPSQFDILTPKFDISQLKKIYISVGFGLTETLMEKLLQLSIVDLHVTAPSYIDGNLLLLALKRCPKMTKICISLEENIAFTTKLLTKYLNKRKFQSFVLASIIDVNIDEFIAFVDTNMAKNGFLRLTFAPGSAHIFEILKNRLSEIAKTRKKEQNQNIDIYLSSPPEIPHETFSIYL